MKNKPHKLFISHSSKDAEYMKAFVDLLVTIGVHKDQITCTSVPQCNIPVAGKSTTEKYVIAGGCVALVILIFSLIVLLIRRRR